MVEKLIPCIGHAHPTWPLPGEADSVANGRPYSLEYCKGEGSLKKL